MRQQRTREISRVRCALALEGGEVEAQLNVSLVQLGGEADHAFEVLATIDMLRNLGGQHIADIAALGLVQLRVANLDVLEQSANRDGLRHRLGGQPNGARGVNETQPVSARLNRPATRYLKGVMVLP